MGNMPPYCNNHYDEGNYTEGFVKQLEKLRIPPLTPQKHIWDTYLTLLILQQEKI